MGPLFPVRLCWPLAPDVTRYRVVARNVLPDRLLTLETDDPALLVDVPAPGRDDGPEWRVQTRSAEGAWSDYLPYLEWPREPDETATVLRWAHDDAVAHRIVVHDDSAGEIVLKAATVDQSYELDWSRLDPSHSYRWRVQRWQDGQWCNVDRYAPLTQPRSNPVVVGGRGDNASTAPSSPGSEVLFLFTSDTEAHLRWMAQPDFQGGIEQQIFGSFDGQHVGIGLQMDLLDAHGFKGTFFVDVLAEYQFGDGSLQPVFDSILERGHDVQLHLHPRPHLRFSSDERHRSLSMATSRDDPAAFRAVMELAIDLHQRRAGRPPVAYRAGAYQIYDSHFPVLADLGIVIDSSINPFKNCHVAPWLQTRTQPFWIDGVLEVPITWHLWHNGSRLRTAQLRPATSPTVQRAALAATGSAADSPPTTVCYIAHSYSFLGTTRMHDTATWEEWNRRWEAYVGSQEREISGYNVGDPVIRITHIDRRRIDTFSGLLTDLGARIEVGGISLAQLAARHDDWRAAPAAGDPLAGYDGRSRRSTRTVTRRYSGSYLEQLESGAA